MEGTASDALGQSNISPKSTPYDRTPVTYPAQLAHEHTLIVLHGRGDYPRQFGEFFRLSPTSYRDDRGHELDLYQLLPYTKFIFPSASPIPARCLNFKDSFNQWFDIDSLRDTTRGEESQILGLRDSAIYLKGIVEEEIANGVPAERIILAGLSQGCATALFFFLTYQPPAREINPIPRFGAIIGMSGWLPFVHRLRAFIILSKYPVGNENLHSEDSSDQQIPEKNRALQDLCKLASVATLPDHACILDTPVFLGHGTEDETIHMRHGLLARDVLQALSIDVEWREYREGHWYCQDEINDIVKFLEEKVGIRTQPASTERERLSTEKHGFCFSPTEP